MGQQRSLIILGLAILLGLCAVFIANAYLSGAEQRGERMRPGMVKLVVARVPLEFGTVITPEKVRMVDWPAGAVPVGAFLWPDGLGSKPRVALGPMTVNEPILRSKVSGEGGHASFAATLRPAMRAVAVRVSDVTGAGGFVLPGDTVDVLVTRALEGANNSQQISDVLIQGVRVLAIDQSVDENSGKPVVGKTATLEVNQFDAQKLALAQTVGSLTLVLRKLEDPAIPITRTVNTGDLRDEAARAYEPPPIEHVSYVPPAPRYRARPRARPKPKVVIIRGMTGTSYEVRSYGAR